MKSERELLRENLERFRTARSHKTEDPAKRSPKFKKLNEVEEPDGLKSKFLNCCSALPIDPDEEGYFEERFAGHTVTVSNDWGGWDRPEYNTIEIDEEGLGSYGNNDPVFNKVIPAMIAKYGIMDDRGRIVDAQGNVIDDDYEDYLQESHNLGVRGKHPIKDPAKRQPKFQRLNESAEDSCQQARDYCTENNLHIKPVSWLEKYMDFPEYYEEQYPGEDESDLRDRMWTDATENGAAIALQEIEAILRAKKEDEYNLYDMVDTDYGFSIVDDPNLSPEDFNY